LNEKKDLPHTDSVKLLRDCLVGYGGLQKVVGINYEITDRMVGYNSEGQVRVWHNDRFSENSPSIIRHSKADRDEEDSFISRLIDTIEPHCKGKQLSLFIKEQLDARKPYRFSTLIQFLS
jgi:hypothetical protein